MVFKKKSKTEVIDKLQVGSKVLSTADNIQLAEFLSKYKNYKIDVTNDNWRNVCIYSIKDVVEESTEEFKQRLGQKRKLLTDRIKTYERDFERAQNDLKKFEEEYEETMKEYESEN